jgi:hypothetical protein
MQGLLVCRVLEVGRRREPRGSYKPTSSLSATAIVLSGKNVCVLALLLPERAQRGRFAYDKVQAGQTYRRIGVWGIRLLFEGYIDQEVCMKLMTLCKRPHPTHRYVSACPAIMVPNSSPRRPAPRGHPDQAAIWPVQINNGKQIYAT